jgi:hypothetical protein
MASPGDLSGDGFRDLAVAASFCCCDVGCFFGCKRRPGRIYFFDGRTGERLGTFELASEAGDGLGKDMIAARDLDGNGYADVLATFNDSPGTTLVAIDGGTREEIYSMLDPYRSSCTYGGFGLEIAAAGDTNADDFPDFLASSACLTGSPWNRIDLVSGAPVGLRALGEPCGDESPRIGATGVPLAGRLYPLHVSRVGPGETAILLVDFPGSASQPPPARRSGSDCARLFPRLSYSTVTRAVRPGEGAATVEIKLPGSAAWIGVRLHAQWLVRGDSGWSASRVLEIEIQPPGRNRAG